LIANFEIPVQELRGSLRSNRQQEAADMAFDDFDRLQGFVIQRVV